MKEFGLNQAALAELMGVKLQRVKNLSAGLVQKLTREEGEALIRKLHIRAEWLVTGEGPMLQTPGEQEFQRRLDVVAKASMEADAAKLTAAQTDVLQRIVLAVQTGDTAALQALLPYVAQPGTAGPAHQVSQAARPYGLSADEAALLENYRRSTPEEQAMVLRALGVVVEPPAAEPVRPSAREYLADKSRKSQPRELDVKAVPSISKRNKK